MVEENAVREDLTFAEMAALAMAARDDPRTEFQSYDEAVTRLYGSLHKMKRSNIRQFVALLHALGPALKWPKAVGRDLGANVGRRLRDRPDLARPLAAKLAAAPSPEAQNAILAAALADRPARAPAAAASRLSFRHGGLSVAAKGAELRIVADRDLAALPRERLEAAVAAFAAALDA
jgi:ParB family chromosome partitioning protein